MKLELAESILKLVLIFYAHQKFMKMCRIFSKSIISYFCSNKFFVIALGTLCAM